MVHKEKGSFALSIALVVLILGLIVGIIFGFYLTRGIPEVDSLAYNLPMETTKVYAKDGTLLQEYGAEKRIIVPFTEISPHFFDALIAVEDANFYKHHGISIKGILRAIKSDISQRKAGQGGSTITMQLARQYFLTPEKTITRKIKEILLSLKIERRYTKQQILEMYANKVCFGHGYYGIEAASRYYFGKKAISLSVEEAAFLAGVIQRPTYYSPKKYPERAKERRDLVLLRMLKTGKLSEEKYNKLVKNPIKVAVSPVEKGIGAYPAERVRIYLESKYSEEDIYEKGLRVFTTIDPKLQSVAVKAVQEGLRNYQRRRPYSGPKRGKEAKSPSEEKELTEGQIYWAKVEEVKKEGIRVFFCGNSYELKKENFKWYPSITPSVIFKEGDSVLISVLKKEPLELQIEDTLEAQSAIFSFNIRTGEVYALVGGSDFSETMFNRVIQAKRQTGSAVKPLIYATAFKEGKNITDTELDAPTLFLYGTENPSQICSEGYIPHDFERHFLGKITLKRALEHSVNICAVRLLNEIGYSKVIDLMRKLHITANLKPYPSMGLGSFEITLWELTGAYGAFANNGVYVTPYFIQKIEDRNGSVLETFQPQYENVLDPDVNFLLVSAMKGVIKRGTAASAANMKGNFAGKTGTTDDYIDAWFIGFNPNIVTGVWTGRDDHKSLGNLETGSRAALPIWRKYMEVATEGQEIIDWKSSDNIVYLPVCTETGLRAGMDSPCTKIVEEPFIKGKEPLNVCTKKNHLQIGLPYFLQKFDLNSDGELMITPSDLETIISSYPLLVQKSGENRIEVNWGENVQKIDVQIVPERNQKAPEAVFDDLPPEGSFRCGAEVKYVHKR